MISFKGALHMACPAYMHSLRRTILTNIKYMRGSQRTEEEDVCQFCTQGDLNWADDDVDNADDDDNEENEK